MKLGKGFDSSVVCSLQQLRVCCNIHFWLIMQTVSLIVSKIGSFSMHLQISGCKAALMSDQPTDFRPTRKIANFSASIGFSSSKKANASFQFLHVSISLDDTSYRFLQRKLFSLWHCFFSYRVLAFASVLSSPPSWIDRKNRLLCMPGALSPKRIWAKFIEPLILSVCYDAATASLDRGASLDAIVNVMIIIFAVSFNFCIEEFNVIKLTVIVSSHKCAF